MLRYVEFHLGLHSLQKYMFAGIQDEKGSHNTCMHS